LLLALLAGCPNPLVTSTDGSLTVSVTNGINAKTLLPPLSMTVASYTISGQGPKGASFSQSTSSGTVTINHLAFGSWTVTVDAFNEDGTPIGQVIGTAVIHTGQTTELRLTVVPLSGDGTLRLTVNWNAEDVDIPGVQACLLTTDGQQELGFDISDTQATNGADGTTLSSGYYALVLQLTDNGLPVMGAMEIVRIVSGQTTTGLYRFDKVNKPGGGLMVIITPDMADPLPERVTAGSTVTATAAVDDPPADVRYAWCLNGVLQLGATGSSWSSGSDLALGYYRLDVAAYTPDGSRAGSATASFEVVSSTVLASDDFETYAVGSYPSAGGWYMQWSGYDAQVVSEVAFSGSQSFRLQGYPSSVRSDGLDLPLDSVNALTYRVAVRIPSDGSVGAKVGFFKYSDFGSIDFNSVWIGSDWGEDIRVVGLAIAHGGSAYATGIPLQRDTWYDIKVHIDYIAETMSAWINDTQVASDIPAEPKSESYAFFVAISWAPVGPLSTAYFDRVVISY
jgi:hypothetical protein